MIYRVTHNLDHVDRFNDFDAELIQFENSGGINYALPGFPYERYAPKVMTFVGNLPRLVGTDFPHTNPTLPMMSMKMLLACLSVGAFPYELHPTRIYSAELKTQELSELQDMTDASVFSEKFFNVHLTTWTDAVDLERTLLAKRDPSQPRAARKYLVYTAAQAEDPGDLDLEAVERLSLNVPEDQLPGLFRMEQLHGLFCAEKTKQACEGAGIVGVTFAPVPVPMGQGVRPYLSGFRFVSDDDLAVF
ncbi:hypothetical protein [Deinococcus aquatilis]|jgi:hypothetical protein|uniref:hypothetical protein n=1 Tax=Deinococcus aquatilis TaxID=519440 RepID=UPI00037AAADD|nr:hypothetical protein [Deinococcus aquatilis]